MRVPGIPGTGGRSWGPHMHTSTSDPREHLAKKHLSSLVFSDISGQSLCGILFHIIIFYHEYLDKMILLMKLREIFQINVFAKKVHRHK